jgi:ATP-dependent DNA ligase
VEHAIEIEVITRFQHGDPRASDVGPQICLVLDGELVAYRGGRLDVAVLGLQHVRRRAAAGVQLVYVAFDLPAARGAGLRRLPYREW